MFSQRSMISFRLWLSITLCISLASGCEKQKVAQIDYYNIDQAYTDHIIPQIQGSKVVTVRSPGGSAQQAIRISDVIIRDMISLEIYDKCVSACVEFLLPAAHNLYIREDTILAVHGNSLINREIIRSFKSNVDHCYKDTADYLENLYVMRGLNLGFWSEEMRRIQPYDFRPLEGGTECGFRHKLKVKYWLPTSQQLCIDPVKTCSCYKERK